MKKTYLILLSFIILIAVLFFSGITIPLDTFDRRLESLLANILERKVTVQGPVKIKLGLQPVLEFEGLTIADPADWSDGKNFVVVKKAKGQLDLLPLIQGDIHINDLELEGVDLRLVTKADKSSNYSFGSPSEETEKAPSWHELTGLDTLRLKDIRLSYLDEQSGTKYLLSIDEAHGHGMKKKQLQFSLKGQLADSPYSLEITGGSLYELLYGKEAWPLTNGKLQIEDTLLDVSGALVRTQNRLNEYLRLSIRGPNLDVISTLFDVELPDTDKFDIAGQLSVLPGSFRLLNLQLNVSDSSLQGNLLLSLEGERSFLSGVLVAPHIDQSLFSVFSENPTESNTKQTKAEQNNSQVPWDLLQSIDVNLQLSVTEMNYENYGFKDIKAVASLIDGNLITPFSLVAMDIPITGRADLFSSRKSPSVKVTAHSESIELAPLVESLSGNKKISGSIGPLTLTAKSNGKSLDEIKERFDLDFTNDATNVLTDTGITISSNDLSLQRRAGQPATLSGSGKALGSPFSLTVHAGTEFNSQKSNSLPINIQLNACETDLLLDAALHADLSVNFDYAINGKKLCGMLNPVTLMLEKETAFSSMGKGQYTPDIWSVKLKTFKLDSYLFDATVEQTQTPAGSTLITVTAHSDELDLQPYLSQIQQNKTQLEKQKKLTEKNKKAKKKTEEPAPEQTLEKINKSIASWLPQKKLLPVDLNVKLTLDKLETGRGAVSDILLSAKVEEGILNSAPFHFTVAEQSVRGDALLDLTTEASSIQLNITATDFDLPALYKEFKLEAAPPVTAETIQLNVSLKGRTLKKLSRNSSQEITITGASYQIKKKFGEDLHIRIIEAKASNVPGENTKLSVSGHLNDDSFSVLMDGHGLLQENTTKPITGKVAITIADTHFTFDGKTNRERKDAHTVKAKYALSGKNMDSLNWLSGINLPPFGPYSINGSFYAENQLFAFFDLVMKVGDSTLLGQTVLAGTKTEESSFDFPVKWDTVLQAKTIQLNDFQLGDWSAVEKDKKEEDKTVKTKKGTQKGETLHNLLSPELAAKFTGSLKILVDEVFSGTDNLGNGVLNAKLADGLYSLDKLKLSIPGGEVLIEGSLKPETNKSSATLSMLIENLDYGVFARRTKPDSDLKGKLNVHFDLHSEAETVFQLREHVNGTFRFGVIPEDYKAGSIDLWAVNIVTAALPVLLKGTPSTANCLAGTFLLEDGIMTPEHFLLDTSKMRVQGKGEVNFKTNAINFHLKPTPKSAHFFSLATPVTIDGTIFDYNVGTSTTAVLGTVFGVASSVITVPFQWIFTDNLETNGKVACSEAMGWVEGTDTVHSIQ